MSLKQFPTVLIFEALTSRWAFIHCGLIVPRFKNRQSAVFQVEHKNNLCSKIEQLGLINRSVKSTCAISKTREIIGSGFRINHFWNFSIFNILKNIWYWKHSITLIEAKICIPYARPRVTSKAVISEFLASATSKDLEWPMRSDYRCYRRGWWVTLDVNRGRDAESYTMTERCNYIFLKIGILDINIITNQISNLDVRYWAAFIP